VSADLPFWVSVKTKVDRIIRGWTEAQTRETVEGYAWVFLRGWEEGMKMRCMRMHRIKKAPRSLGPTFELLDSVCCFWGKKVALLMISLVK
jgi:hypothetical protein